MEHYLYFIFGMKEKSIILTHTMYRHLNKFEYGEKVSCNLFQKAKLSYILESLHVK